MDRVIVVERDLFEEAIDVIKGYEGWHDEGCYPYVGYGHRVREGEHFAGMSYDEGELLLRRDLMDLCGMFHHYGRDSLLLAVLAYHVGPFALLGCEFLPRSKLIRKLDSGNRDIRSEYLSYCKFNGRVLPVLLKRREREYDLLFNRIKVTVL